MQSYLFLLYSGINTISNETSCYTFSALYAVLLLSKDKAKILIGCAGLWSVFLIC